jgi:agmatinase
VTFDIDALDASVMPATGTPTPGGLSYLQALAILRRAAEVATIVGGDLVELAPVQQLHACDYTAAALAYKMLSYALSGTKPRQ